ncbi:17102_t:CDS:2 [Funneliformis geosporum]|nr:17102_t:CDS:2 [Funneliformis geosporum]
MLRKSPTITSPKFLCFFRGENFEKRKLGELKGGKDTKTSLVQNFTYQDIKLPDETFGFRQTVEY